MAHIKSETKTGKATVRTAFGKAVEPPIEYSYEYKEVSLADPTSKVSAADILAELGDDAPSAEDILLVVSNKRAASESAKVKTKEFEKRDIKAPTLEDSNVAVKAMAKVFRAQNKGMSQAEAETAARAALGIAEPVTA